MLPGQYKGAYGIGLHRNSYEALRQKKPMKYWRDKNCNGILDLGGNVFEEIAYTNIHRATNVKDKYGNSFTYTLFTEDNFMCKNKDLK